MASSVGLNGRLCIDVQRSNTVSKSCRKLQRYNVSNLV